MQVPSSGRAVTDRAIDHSRHEASDEVLAEAAKVRSTEFAELYRRHWLGVFRYLHAISGSPDDAADLTALAFERAYTAIHSFQSQRGSFAGWLYRLARNAAIDARRRRRPLPALMSLGDADAIDDWTPEHAALRSEEHAELIRRVRQLPPPQPEALALRYGADLTARQIGEVLGKSEDATHKVLQRGLAALKEIYRDH
jgi:RNA polymerase sigma-70 factor (ECF subfamily)